MTPIARARRLLGPVLVAAVALGSISAAVWFRRSAAAPAGAAPAAEGVVCFGTVDLEHGATALDPLQPGRVARVLVRENQPVAEGTELLRLEDGTARSRLAEANAAVELGRLQLRRARRLPDQHRGRVAHQEAMLEAMRRRLDAARRALAHKQKLALPALLAAQEVAASEEKVHELEALERVESQRLADLQAQDLEGDIQRAEFELAAADARCEQARLALEECRLRAPGPGTVLRLLVGPGDVAGGRPGQPAVLFAGDGPQVIRATVEQEFAHRIRTGQLARVQDETDPSLSWRGRVERVADWYSQRRAMLHDPSQLSDVRTLECVIVLDPGQSRLRLGQSVRVLIGGLPL
jgi:multidrug resistance efflux pump